MEIIIVQKRYGKHLVQKVKYIVIVIEPSIVLERLAIGFDQKHAAPRIMVAPLADETVLLLRVTDHRLEIINDCPDFI